MKTGNIIKWLPVALLTVCSLSACNKWLDVRPESEVKEDQLFSTAQGFKDALFGGYTLMTTPGNYGGEMTMGTMSAIAQDYDLSNPLSFYYQVGRYNYTSTDSRARIDALWTENYRAIANLNNLLEQIDAKKSLFAEAEFNLIKGEALGLRAYLHFDLLRIFAPAYIVNKDAVAIPYVVTYSKKVTPRSTVAQITELALKDLDAAETLLQNDPVKNAAAGDGSGTDMYYRRTSHFNKFAVNALKARIFLYRNEKPQALAQALKVINNGGQFRFVEQSEASAGPLQRDRTFSPEHVFALYISNLIVYADQHFRGSQVYDAFANKSDNYRNIFEVNTGGGSTDYRYNYLIETDNGQLYSSKFWQLEGAASTLKYLMPMIRLSEMYYIAAESEPAAADGIAWLNEVRTHRGLAALPDNLSAQDLQSEILKEYRKEFYSEGQTFYQYKRLNLPAIPGTTVPATAEIYVLPIPVSETEFGN